MTGDANLRRLLAAHLSLLAAFKDARRAVFECVANAAGSIDDLEGQLLVSIMDDIIAESDAALAPYADRWQKRTALP